MRAFISSSQWQLARRARCVGLTGVFVSAMFVLVANAADTDEARLRAIRQAMVDAAVSANTHVQATSWMDSDGALREFNRFTSEIRVRDVRLQEAGDPEAKARLTPVKEATPVAAQVERVQPESCIKPAAKTVLRHVMLSVVTVSPDLAPAERYFAQLVGRTAMAAMTARAAHSNYWRATQEMGATRVYDRQYLSHGQEHVQWQLQLLVEPASAGTVAQEAPALTLRWLVRPRAQQQAWLTQTDFVPPSRSTLNATTPRVDAAMAQSIEQSVASFAQTLDEHLACDPQAMALHMEDGHLVVNAGDLSGLRVGDRLLLTDPRLLPQHVLEPQALDSAVLAEVKSISAYRAELKQVAGPKQKPNPAWVAWPYTY